MRISDWSSEVCSSDLEAKIIEQRRPQQPRQLARVVQCAARDIERVVEAMLEAEVAGAARIVGDALQLIGQRGQRLPDAVVRSEEHTSELQSLMRISYAVFCLKKKKNIYNTPSKTYHNHSSI